MKVSAHSRAKESHWRYSKYYCRIFKVGDYWTTHILPYVSGFVSLSAEKQIYYPITNTTRLKYMYLCIDYIQRKSVQVTRVNSSKVITVTFYHYKGTECSSIVLIHVR
jgi:hypothetical protein